MKIYIKPSIGIYFMKTIDLCQISTSVDGGEGPGGGGPSEGGAGDAKDRDLEEDEMFLLLEEYETGNKNSLW